MEDSRQCTQKNIRCATAAAPAKRSRSGPMLRNVSSVTAASSPRGTGENQQHASHIYNKPLRTCSRHDNLRVLLSVLLIFTTWTSLLDIAIAGEPHAADRRKISALPAVPLENDSPAWKGATLLVVDTRPPPVLPLMHLQRRDGSSTTSASSTKTSITTDPSATASDFAVPRPFDTALSNNFTSPCASFFKRMLSDTNFNNCHPFSLMLQTSSGLFDASKSFIRITRTLEATCAVNSDQCTNTMDGFARDLVSDANCKVDWTNDNPQVLQAYNGLLAYEPLYQASCLRDDEGSYCYANAVTNTTATTDAYPYYLPLGVALPGGSRPTCNSCLVDVMAIFSSFGGNTTQPVSKTYNTAAGQINTYCGPNFVNGSATPLKGAASATTASLIPTITLFIMLFVLLFQ